MSKQEHSIEGKRAYHLLPFDALDQVALVMAYGAGKHGEGDYKGPEAPTPEYCLGAAMRHISDHLQGDSHDAGSKLPHLAHATARCLIALHLEMKKQFGAQLTQEEIEGMPWAHVMPVEDSLTPKCDAAIRRLSEESRIKAGV